MLRVGVDLYSIINRNVGVGEYSFCLGEELVKQIDRMDSNDFKFVYFVPKGYKGVFGPTVDYVEVNKWLRIYYRVFGMKLDIFHSVHQYGFMKYVRGAQKQLLTVHDINFVYEKAPNKLKKYSSRFIKKIERADYIVYISQFVKRDVESHFNVDKKPSRVIYNGVKQLNCLSNLSLEKPPVDGYLLHVSSLLPKKNIELMIRMMEHLPNERLVIVGNWSGKYGRKCLGVIEELGLVNVYPLSNVTEEFKSTLYARCKGFLFPSLCEGFGMPPIEAMYFGKPVFLSKLTSLPEIGGDLAHYFNELQPEAMAKTIEEAFETTNDDPDLLKQWASKFSWKTCGENYLNLYNQLCK